MPATKNNNRANEKNTVADEKKKPRVPAVERLRQELAAAEERERKKLAKQTELLQLKVDAAADQVVKAQTKYVEARKALDDHLANAPMVTDGVGVNHTADSVSVFELEDAEA